MTFTWQGRRLNTATANGKVLSFAYNADGIRTQKTVDGVTTYYTLDGTQIIRQKTGNTTVFFEYDANGTPTTILHAGTTYYYIRNVFGDVIGLADANGNTVVSYTYDPWGKLLSISDSTSTGIGTLNPFRYRGYYYDTETGLYYVSSRYYDPEIGRWINADGYVSTGQDITGYNMFAYCGNNPVNRIDTTGQFWIGALILTAVVAVCTITLSSCSKPHPATPPSTPSPNPNDSSSPENPVTTPSVPAGGTTVHKGSIRICTDGSDGTKVPDSNWYPETAYSHNGKPLDAYTIPYVVIPIGDSSAKLGDSALLINHDTNMSIMCVVGERGPAKNGWGEVSIAAIWKTGNQNHMTANHASGLGENYEIILYPGVRYKWSD